MKKILLLGSGKIGRTIASFLSSTDYQVTVADINQEELNRLKKRVPNVHKAVRMNAENRTELVEAMSKNDAVLSALSFRFNPLIAEVALERGLSYFDLTEDVETTRRVREIATQAKEGQIFMPQCGLAPGFISVVAKYLTQGYEKLDTVHMRVGALPEFPSNIMKYNLTWSTDGLINEYCNPCEAIHEGERQEVLPLEGHEEFSLDGIRYEAFNTSGGLGTLCETFDGKVRELNYRTIRYPGHRELMAFLLDELRLSQRRELLKDILESAIPITYQDVVVVFSSVTGWKDGRYVQTSDARKIYMQRVDNTPWSAIQITTAAGICAAVDLHMLGKLPAKGFVRQEDIAFPDFIENRFGKYYATS
ncbi:MAG: saccharopine dehydrogenase NADP-binding domain-containing protein [Pirellulaceae bacterium]|nr:saccharopine dehydrogenase NADP-binding domain-containing protein [Pirellulaceae bacterium]